MANGSLDGKMAKIVARSQNRCWDSGGAILLIDRANCNIGNWN